ncbi:hypothetical protein [Methylobacterium sp. DCY52]|uniref:hypothetical protein n=1 Tax=Methylobacterium sp. DCY52 TaxID=739139 RepID=UPI001369A659
MKALRSLLNAAAGSPGRAGCSGVAASTIALIAAGYGPALGSALIVGSIWATGVALVTLALTAAASIGGAIDPAHDVTLKDPQQ